MSVEDTLQDLRSKFKNLTDKELLEKVKEALNCSKTKRSRFASIEQALDGILAAVKDIPQKTFTKLSKEAWKRKYPEGREIRTNAYSEFLKEKYKELKIKYPHSTYGEILQHVSVMWKQHKLAMGITSPTPSITTMSQSQSTKQKNPKGDVDMGEVNQPPNTQKNKKVKTASEAGPSKPSPRRSPRSAT